MKGVASCSPEERNDLYVAGRFSYFFVFNLQ